MSPRALYPLVALTLCLCMSNRLAARAPTAPQLPERLSLEEALRLFRAHGLDLLIAEAAIAGAEGDARAARQIYNPGIAYTFSHVFNYDPARVCPPESPGAFGGSAACSPNIHGLTLSDNAAISDVLVGKRGLRIGVTEAALRAARMARLDAERTLTFQVEQQYMQAVLAHDLLDFALEVQKGWTQTFELSHLRHQAGAISEAEEARSETAKLEADQMVKSAQQALLTTKLGLAFLLGVRDESPRFEVAADLPKFYVPPRLAGTSMAALLTKALAVRPDLKLVEAQRERAAWVVRQSRRARVPDLALQAGVNYAAPGGGAFSSNTVPPTLLVGISSNLPLFYQQQGEIRRAEADLGAQEASLAKVRAQVLSDLGTAWGSYETSRDLVERMEGRLLDRARRARDLTKLQYEKGATSLLEYLDASRTYIATNVEYLSDLAGYWIAILQLEQSSGVDLRGAD